MTRAEFRTNFMAILEKADIINENIEFMNVDADFYTQKSTSDGHVFDTIGVRVYEYEKCVHRFHLHSSFKSDTDKIKEILALLDEIIDGIKEVI